MTCRFITCPYPVSLLEHEGGSDELCFYHWKVSAGLLDPDDSTVRRALGVRYTKAARVIRGVAPSDVVSDQQLELGNLLRYLGAPPELVKRAFRHGA